MNQAQTSQAVAAALHLSNITNAQMQA